MKKITAASRLWIKFAMLFISDSPSGARARGILYEPYLLEHGKNLKIAAQAFIYNPNKLRVGNNVYIGFNAYLGEGEITLKDEVLIGPFVSITASNHLMKERSFRFGGFAEEPIIIGKGTWLGAHTCVTAGVKIGDACLVGAGAIVTKSFPDGLIIGGVPANAIGENINCEH
ncbi:MAG: Galactoside O-acetyltransferase [Syntrophus sp. PtaB.Bin001]|jgi:maltose O-acetyltransferase|nr:MAG: Galactoside O-acetyltransferase [Syntrophus sp. PtaB.Bin001]